MDKQALWNISSETTWIKALKDGVSLQELIKTTKIPDEIPLKKSIICCDGRCPHNGREISLAGSGILMSPETLEKFITETGVTTITSHSDCGAAKLAFLKLDSNTAATFSDAGDYAKKWSQAVAKQYGLGYKHIEAVEFSAKLHHERGIILDSTLKFHPSMFEGMPNMFIANSPRYAEDEYIQAVVEVLTGIGFGDHGFGDLLTSEDPFYILINARDEVEAKNLTDICRKAVSNYGNSVVIKSCSL